MMTLERNGDTITNSAGTVLFNVAFRDGKFDFVPSGRFNPSKVPVTTFENFQAGEYWCLAMAMEFDPIDD